jgi:prevent-host-death family protein
MAAELAILLAMTELPLAKVRDRLSELVADVESTHARVIITKHGHPAAVLISPDDLASLEETIDVLSTPGALEQIREAEAEVARGETFDEQTIRGDLARRDRQARSA